MAPIGIISLALALGSSLLQAGTTLSKAAISGDVAKIQACLASGEQVDELDKWGWTPLMWAVYYKYIPATQVLLDHKANPNIQNTLAYGPIPKKSTPLIISAYYDLEEHARLLLKAGADPEITNEKGKKALDYARDFSFQDMLELLDKGKARAEATKPQAAPKPPPAPPAQAAPRVQPAREKPIPAKKPAPAKKPVPPKKQEVPPKSEPPAIK